MTWCWIAYRPRTGGVEHTTPPMPAGVAEVHDRNGSAGELAWWDKSAPRPVDALRVDARVVSGGGPARWVSWCRLAGEQSFAFDDPMVTECLRRRLSAPWPTFASTLLVNWSRIAGSITGAETIGGVVGDPFASVFPRRLLRVADGVLGAIAPPTGPGVTRYGSGNPWPIDTYAGQVE